MRISGSFLKARFARVYWVAGAACAGKTTIRDLPAERHGLVAYHSEGHFDEHKTHASADYRPALRAPFHG